MAGSESMCAAIAFCTWSMSAWVTPMSTLNVVFIHSGGDLDRLKILASSTVDTGRKITSPQKFTTTKKLSPNSRTCRISPSTLIQSPTPKGFV